MLRARLRRRRWRCQHLCALRGEVRAGSNLPVLHDGINTSASTAVAVLVVVSTPSECPTTTDTNDAAATTTDNSLVESTATIARASRRCIPYDCQHSWYLHGAVVLCGAPPSRPYGVDFRCPVTLVLYGQLGPKWCSPRASGCTWSSSSLCDPVSRFWLDLRSTATAAHSAPIAWRGTCATAKCP